MYTDIWEYDCCLKIWYRYMQHWPMTSNNLKRNPQNSGGSWVGCLQELPESVLPICPRCEFSSATSRPSPSPIKKSQGVRLNLLQVIPEVTSPQPTSQKLLIQPVRDDIRPALLHSLSNLWSLASSDNFLLFLWSFRAPKLQRSLALLNYELFVSGRIV